MKTLKQYEEHLKECAFKSHDLALEADIVSIDTALFCIESAQKEIFDEILKLYVVDGNPEVWKGKIEQLQSKLLSPNQ